MGVVPLPAEVLATTFHFAKSNWIAIIVTAIALRAVYLRYFHPLAKFPGPFLASITDFYELRLFFTQRECEFEEKLHKKYGPIVRIRPNTLFIDDPSVLPIVFHKTVNKTNYHKSAGFGFGVATIGAIEHKEHARIRKRVAPSYTMTAIREMEGYVDERVNEWISKLDERFAGKPGKEKTTFDLSPWSNYLAYDVLSDTVFGEAFGFCKTASDVGGLIQALHDGMVFGGILARLHKLNDLFFHRPLNGLLPKATDTEGVGAVMGFRDRILYERIEKGSSSKRKDVLSTLLAAKSPDGSPMSIDDIKAELLVGMLAGSDTTAASIRHFLTRLLEHPDVYKKVLAEIDAVFEKPGFKHNNGIINYDEVAYLPYLTAAIRESMRVKPPVPAFLLRPVHEPGYEILGQHIPAGTQIGLDAWVMTKNKKFYGEDALEYKPERWLGEDFKRLDKYDFTFGYGSRVCLGKNLAQVELNKAVITFLRRFKPALAPEPANAPYKKSSINYGIWAEKGYWMDIERRDVPEWKQ